MNDEARAALVDELAKLIRTSPLNRRLSCEETEEIAEEFFDRHIDRLLADAAIAAMREALLSPEAVEAVIEELFVIIDEYLSSDDGSWQQNVGWARRIIARNLAALDSIGAGYTGGKGGSQ